MRLSDIRDDDYYTIEILGKPILGKHLKNSYIRKGIHEEILRRKEEIENARRFYLNIGDIPVIQFNAKPPAYIIRSNFQGLRDLLLELDMPEDPRHAYCSMLFQGSNLLLEKKRKDEKFKKKYSVEIFGLFLRLSDTPSYNLRDWFLNEKSQYKCQPRYWSSRSGHIVQIWRLRLFSCPATHIQSSILNPLSQSAPKVAYLEERWHPQQDLRLALCGLEHLSNSKISPFIQFTRDALRVIGKTKRAGRPPWSGKYKSPEHFLTKYRAAYFDLLLKTGDEPIQQAVANRLRISLANLKILIRKSEASWPPF